MTQESDELRSIVDGINALLVMVRAKNKEALHQYRIIGQNCIDAKKIIPVGDFDAWVKKVGLSKSLCSQVMQLAEGWHYVAPLLNDKKWEHLNYDVDHATRAAIKIIKEATRKESPPGHG